MPELTRAGRFEVSVAPLESPYELSLRADSRVPMRCTLQALEPGSVHDLGDVVMAPGCLVAGTVSDPDGIRLAGVRVRMWRDGARETVPANRAVPSTQLELLTGADGTFAALDALPPGSWRARLAMPHQLAGAEPRFEVEQDQRTLVLDLTGKAVVSVLRGDVVDQAGQPVAGATVEILSGRHAEVTCDGVGRFAVPRIEGDSSATVELQARAQGFDLSAAASWPWAAPPVRLVLTRSPRVVLEVAREDDGQPVLEYGVRIVQEPGGPGGLQVGLALPCASREQGRLELPPLPRRRYFVWVEPRADTLTPCLTSFTVEALPSACRVLVPKAARRLCRVVDARDRPIAGTRVELLQPLRPEPVTLTTQVATPRAVGMLGAAGAIVLQEGVTDTGGELTLAGPPRKMLAVRVLGPGHRPLVVHDVLLDHTSPLVVRAAGGGVVTGSVGPAQVLAQLGPTAAEQEAAKSFAAAGTPFKLPRPRIELRALGDPARRFPESPGDGSVSDEGRFRIEGVPAGSWQVCLVCQLPGGSRSSGASLTEPLATVHGLQDGEERTVQLDCAGLATGSLSARVLVDGEPLLRHEVNLLCRRPGLRWGTFELAEASTAVTTDGDGRIEVSDLAPGSYALEAILKKPGGGEASLRNEQVATVTAGGTAECTFVLERRTLRVRVLRADGTPETGRAFQVMQERYIARAGTTDAEGWLVLESVLPGAFDLVTWPHELAAQDAQFAYIRAHPYPQWLDALVRLGPVQMPAGQKTAEVELRLPR